MLTLLVLAAIHVFAENTENTDFSIRLSQYLDKDIKWLLIWDQFPFRQ